MDASIEALRRANPRSTPGFSEAAEHAARAARVHTAAAQLDARPARRPAMRRRVVGTSAAGLATAAAVTVALVLASPSGGPAIEDATAAVKQAAIVTAVSATQSGEAVVRITHGGEPWAGTTIRWHGSDIRVVRDFPTRAGKTGGDLRVVDGRLYELWQHDERWPGGRWVALGDPSVIDPGSGTTPAEVLAAVQEDVGGTTLHRIVDAISGLRAEDGEDGSTVYRGTVAAGVIARETGAKDGERLRVFPFGYVAHDEAADPASPLDTRITVDTDGVVREIVVAWGAGSSAWIYTVRYSGLGTTPPLEAPQNAIDIRELRGLEGS
jgi:hypothetical protein